jgi:hypothetical protein
VTHFATINFTFLGHKKTPGTALASGLTPKIVVGNAEEATSDTFGGLLRHSDQPGQVLQTVSSFGTMGHPTGRTVTGLVIS